MSWLRDPDDYRKYSTDLTHISPVFQAHIANPCLAMLLAVFLFHDP
jgi:hypothetical protein